MRPFLQTCAANEPKGKVRLKTGVSLNSTNTIEGSADGAHGRLADVEVNGSGYPTDDEDGDDVHGSGSPVPPPSTDTKSKPITTMKPASTTTTATVIYKPVPVQPVVTSDRHKELHVDEEDDEDDDEDDEDDFADENVNDDTDIETNAGATTTTTHRPETTTRRAFPTNPPPRVNQPTTTPSSGPFSPFHETITNGIYAGIAGGILVAVIISILLVLFVIFRIRKKDEGSYALDEPKQARPYATYAYTKASTKEFYA
ncbi:unnamed protein product [Caenorhabditis bovis]|uniref:Syndecan n=1 Tax=Caenorhabditis bovis TaxID=2654633 RepID=A0A8S1FB99_9PELO|nr:unnamed protein product [Caenorhabditis bovis]